MKGIAHFVTGVAAASLFPGAVQAGANGNPLYFVLGGVAGLLPDTLDFKLWRFFYRHDMEVMPDPNDPDPRVTAEAMAHAVGRAADTGRPVRVKLDTVRLGADAWQQYTVTLDPAAGMVRARNGPAVNTGGRPLPGPRSSSRPAAEVSLAAPVSFDYEAATTIDAFDGPVFEMVPKPDGSVRVRFIPWHRQWSHSLVTGLVPAALAAALFGWQAAAIVGLAWAARALLDQLGYLGVNLLYPFTKQRIEGAKRTHSTEPLANATVVWLSMLVVFWNLYRHADVPFDLSFARYVFYGAALPLALAWVAGYGRRHGSFSH